MKAIRNGVSAALLLCFLSLGLAAQDAEAPAPDASPSESPSATASPTPEPEPEPPKPAAKIYVTDSENGRILIMDDLNGANLRELGTAGYGQGRFLDPSQIWVDQGKFVYIADTGNDRVVCLEMDQVPIWTEINGLSEPEGVAVWGEEIYVSNTGEDHIAVFKVGEKKPHRTIADPRLKRPSKLWFDEAGKLYVSCGEDPPGGTVVMIADPVDLKPNSWEVYEGKGLRPSGYQPAQALLRKGRILSIDASSNRLTAVDNVAGQRARELGGYGSGLGRFMRPEGLGLDEQGRIYIADTGNDRIVRIDDPTGAGWTEFDPGRDHNAYLRGPKSIFIWAPSKPAPPEPPPEENDKKEE